MDYMNNTADRELDWGDVIENEGREYVLLPAGDYPFQVINLEKARHDNPNSKIPPCPKAVLTLRVADPTGKTADVNCDLFLHTQQEWKLCQFFTCVGLRRKGEAFSMASAWGRVVGSRGYLNLGVREYTRRDGEIGKSNEIKRFYPAEEAPAAPAAPAYAQPAAPAYQPPAPGGWNPR